MSLNFNAKLFSILIAFVILNFSACIYRGQAIYLLNNSTKNTSIYIFGSKSQLMGLNTQLLKLNSCIESNMYLDSGYLKYTLKKDQALLLNTKC